MRADCRPMLESLECRDVPATALPVLTPADLASIAAILTAAQASAATAAAQPLPVRADAPPPIPGPQPLPDLIARIGPAPAPPKLPFKVEYTASRPLSEGVALPAPAEFGGEEEARLDGQPGILVAL